MRASQGEARNRRELLLAQSYQPQEATLEQQRGRRKLLVELPRSLRRLLLEQRREVVLAALAVRGPGRPLSFPPHSMRMFDRGQGGWAEAQAGRRLASAGAAAARRR